VQSGLCLLYSHAVLVDYFDLLYDIKPYWVYQMVLPVVVMATVHVSHTCLLEHDQVVDLQVFLDGHVNICLGLWQLSALKHTFCDV